MRIFRAETREYFIQVRKKDTLEKMDSNTGT